MTPGELIDHSEIFQRREEREWTRTAWLAHHVMAAFVGSDKAPSVKELLGKVTDA